MMAKRVKCAACGTQVRFLLLSERHMFGLSDSVTEGCASENTCTRKAMAQVIL